MAILFKCLMAKLLETRFHFFICQLAKCRYLICCGSLTLFLFTQFVFHEWQVFSFLSGHLSNVRNLLVIKEYYAMTYNALTIQTIYIEYKTIL